MSAGLSCCKNTFLIKKLLKHIIVPLLNNIAQPLNPVLGDIRAITTIEISLFRVYEINSPGTIKLNASKLK